MAYKTTDDCISCARCEPECPNQAITEGESIFVIDSDKCTECVGEHESPHCVDVCPVDACILDEQHHETKEQLLAKWRQLHPGREPAPGTY